MSISRSHHIYLHSRKGRQPGRVNLFTFDVIVLVTFFTPNVIGVGGHVNTTLRNVTGPRRGVCDVIRILESALSRRGTGRAFYPLLSTSNQPSNSETSTQHEI